MTCWPVIIREMRAEARHVTGPVLRVLGATAFIGVFWLLISNPSASGTQIGRRLFSALNYTLFVSLWICVPLVTADCISREKREGTLGLLFLTPLSARGIVIGKSLIQALRGLTLVLAAMPVLVLPFFYGGIVWQDAVLALVIHLSALGAGLAAGLIASCLTRQHVRSFILAEVLSLVFCIPFSSLLNGFFDMELGELLFLPMGWIKPWGDSGHGAWPWHPPHIGAPSQRL
jgi:ABC-type transport system involved in multi-copper enzyme maturation permease subunit